MTPSADGQGVGYAPDSGVIMDSAGNIYGTARDGAHDYGSVFLLPHAGAPCTPPALIVLHSFNGSDGSEPSGLVRNSAGNLYGVTKFGGAGWIKGKSERGAGLTYRLSPPAAKAGEWTFTILHKPTTSFFSEIGVTAINPRLTLGPDGKLYGTANGPTGTGGSVFRLTP